MSRRHKRIPRPARCPTLVALELAPEVELTERQALQGFIDGWAGVRQFDVLADVRDLLMLAAAERNDEQTLAVCELAFVALLAIKDRFLTKQRMGCTGEELKALRVLVEVSQDFWRRQSGEAFRLANEALTKARAMERAKAAA